MSYKLKSPCAECPFRTDIRPYLRPERVEEILSSQGEFHCHKTITVGGDIDDDETWGEVTDDSKAQVCAGFLICLEHDEQPNQMMRIAERLRMYDPSKLDMNAPVYWSVSEAIEAHERADAAPGGKVKRREAACPAIHSDPVLHEKLLKGTPTTKAKVDYQPSAEFPEELK